MKLHTLPFLLFLPAGIVVGMIMVAVLSVALAEDSELDSDPRVIPYNGVLEFNGAAYNGQADFRFSIVTEDGNDCTFSEEQGDVVVYSGRFGVNLGSTAENGVADCIFNSQEVYIAIEVRDSASDGEYTALSGRQRIRPVPFSYWSAEGSDFKVDGGLAVGGNLTVAGTVSNPDGDVVIADNIDLYGTIQNPNDDGVILINDTLDVTGSLAVGANSSGELQVGGNAVIGGRLQSSSGPLVVDDSMDVEQELNLKGELYTEGDGPVVINDAVDITGGADMGGALNVTTTTNLGSNGIGAINIANSTTRLSLDGNEVQAYDNTDTASTLSLQARGGTTRVHNDLEVRGKITLGDVVGDGSEGCMRIGSLQQCWGTTTSGQGELFTVAFPNSSYNVTLTALEVNPRPATVASRTNNFFVSRTFQSNGDVNNGSTVMYMAIGTADDDLWEAALEP